MIQVEWVLPTICFPLVAVDTEGGFAWWAVRALLLTTSCPPATGAGLPLRAVKYLAADICLNLTSCLFLATLRWIDHLTGRWMMSWQFE